MDDDVLDDLSDVSESNVDGKEEKRLIKIRKCHLKKLKFFS